MDYKSYIGVKEDYNIHGIEQLNLLASLGLNEDSHVLDIGCGSLSLGRFLIMMLREKHYYAIEPNKWLIDDAIKNELGSEIIVMKNPQFSYSSDFVMSPLWVTFDYIFADSIFTHCNPEKIKQCLRRVKKKMSEKSIFICTFLPGPTNFNKNEDWIYPEMYTYEAKYIKKIIQDCGLNVDVMDWHHRYGKIWLKITL